LTGGFQPVRAALCVMAGLVSLCAIYAFFFYVPDLYGGFDGVLMKHLVIERLRWLTPFQFSALNPYQGTANIWFMTSAWLNPGYAVFALLPELRHALPASYSIFALLYAGATFLFARTLAPAINPAGAWAIGLLASLSVLPPFARVVGVYPTFEFAPGGAYYAAIYLVLLALLLRLGHGSVARQAGLGLALAALALFGIACDPMWMPMLFLSAVPFGLAAIIADLQWRAALTRTVACLVIVAAFHALGVVDYVAGIGGHTARLYFWRESLGLPRSTTFVFFALQNSRGFWLAILFVPGFLLAAIWGSRRVRVMAIACLASMAGQFAYSVAFLTLRMPWPYPLPLYLEIMSIPVFFVVASIGWCAFARRVAGRSWKAAWAVPLALIILASWSVAKFHPNERPELAAIGARTSPVEIVRILIEETALEPGSAFRGATAAGANITRRHDDYKRALGHALYFPDLWSQRVPTFHEYSQLVTPAMYYLVSRLIGSPPFNPHNFTPLLNIAPKAIDVLRALGVRFLLSERQLDTQAALRAQWKGPGIDAFLYELGDPNLGNYSPTRVLPRRLAREALAELGAPEFDFRRDVVLEQVPEVPLVPARGARLVFERGWARVVAQSDGVSLLLLPIQFSHCLVLEASPDVRLVRANFVQLGLIFRGTLDARLNYRFSPLTQPRCRNADLDDMRRAGLQEEVKPAEPDWATHAPWSQYPWPRVARHWLKQLIRGL